MSLISYLKKLNWISSDSPIQTDLNKWEQGISDCVNELNNNTVKLDASTPFTMEQLGVDPTSAQGLATKNYVDINDNKTIVPLGTCSTTSATAEKAVTLSGFVLATGVTIQVTFTNANTADVPTLNVNSTGAKAIYNEAGTAVSATNPAYFPAGSTVEFTYNGTNWVFKKRVIENYINGASWYRVYSDGWIEQGGELISTTEGVKTITLAKVMSNSNYGIQITYNSYFAEPVWGIYTGFVPASRTTKTFQIHDNGINGNNSVITSYIWEAKGY